MRHTVVFFFALLLSACAAQPTSFVAPAAVGKPGSEVSKLVAASEAGLFPCSILKVSGASGAAAVDLGGHNRSDVTVLPGLYRIALHCASSYHSFEPQAEMVAQAGRTYRITGYLVDDSITIFTMKMGAKVAELP
jgi:hypothetical protein